MFGGSAARMTAGGAAFLKAQPRALTSRFLIEQSRSSRKLSKNDRMEATFFRSSSSSFADLLSRLVVSAVPEELPPPSLLLLLLRLDCAVRNVFISAAADVLFRGRARVSPRGRVAPSSRAAAAISSLALLLLYGGCGGRIAEVDTDVEIWDGDKDDALDRFLVLLLLGGEDSAAAAGPFDLTGGDHGRGLRCNSSCSSAVGCNTFPAVIYAGFSLSIALVEHVQ